MSAATELSSGTSDHERWLASMEWALKPADLQTLCAEVVGLLRQAFAVDRSTLFVMDPATLSLRSLVADGMNRALVVPLRIGVVGASILHRHAVRVDDAAAHPFFNAELDRALGFHTRSMLVAPMLAADGRVLGALELLNRRAGRFSDADEAEAVAAAARIARSLEQGTMYPAAVEAEAVATRHALDCERVSVFSLDDRSSRLSALYADGDPRRLMSLNMKLGIAGMVAITGNSVMLKDAWDDRRFDRSVDARTGYRTRSMLCVAIRNGDEPACGVIQLINQESGAFSPAQLGLLHVMARMLAPALHAAVQRAGSQAFVVDAAPG